METDPEPAYVGTQVDTRKPMETDEPSSDGQARLPSQPSNPRSRARTTASTSPSGMWFCPMPRCHASRGPHRRVVAACCRWYPIPARCTYQPLRPGRTQVLTPMGSVCAWPAGNLPHKGLPARDHAAPWRYWWHLPWRTRPPPSTGMLATGRASPVGPGPGAPTGDPDFDAAQGPHRGLLHVRPGSYLPAAGPGTGADMGDPGSASLFPPHRPRSPRPGWQGNEVLFDTAVSTQLPGGCTGPVGGTDRPHTPAGCDRRPPDARSEQGRGTGDGYRLAPSVGRDSSGRPGPPSGRGAETCPPTPDVRWGL